MLLSYHSIIKLSGSSIRYRTKMLSCHHTNLALWARAKAQIQRKDSACATVTSHLINQKPAVRLTLSQSPAACESHIRVCLISHLRAKAAGDLQILTLLIFACAQKDRAEMLGRQPMEEPMAWSKQQQWQEKKNLPCANLLSLKGTSLLGRPCLETKM